MLLFIPWKQVLHYTENINTPTIASRATLFVPVFAPLLTETSGADPESPPLPDEPVAVASEANGSEAVTLWSETDDAMGIDEWTGTSVAAVADTTTTRSDAAVGELLETATEEGADDALTVVVVYRRSVEVVVVASSGVVVGLDPIP